MRVSPRWRSSSAAPTLTATTSAPEIRWPACNLTWSRAPARQRSRAASARHADLRRALRLGDRRQDPTSFLATGAMTAPVLLLDRNTLGRLLKPVDYLAAVERGCSFRAFRRRVKPKRPRPCIFMGRADRLHAKGGSAIWRRAALCRLEASTATFPTIPSVTTCRRSKVAIAPLQYFERSIGHADHLIPLEITVREKPRRRQRARRPNIAPRPKRLSGPRWRFAAAALHGPWR